MNSDNIMQRALGEQWQQLPPALQQHYQHADNKDIGTLDVEYPRFMQPYLNLLRLFGALLNRPGQGINTTVKKQMRGNTQYWERSVQYQNGKTLHFKSRWVFAKDNELIEYVNPLLGLRMAVTVINGELHYQGKHMVLRLGKLLIPIPEWLLLGHTTIIETAIDDRHFTMDFRLHHPIFGQLYRYAGRFKTQID
ncbi:MAG: DUF4166 domain-containing protein [Gammaproteobacteria bacterium]|nr:DUF4166 domain-containing protein [Gammaproteobacteria bacterium]